MGRAVGGAAGAGCAGFSLVGILMGVGLVVWLGSTITTGIGGDDGPSAIERPPPSAAVDLTIPGATFAGATIRVTAPAPLGADEIVSVTGAGFPPGPVEVTTCLTGGFRTSDGLVGCDTQTTVAATADAEGAFALDYPVTRIVGDELGTDYDCAAFAAACSVVGHPKDAFDDGPSAGLTFATDLPTVKAERPPDH